MPSYSEWLGRKLQNEQKYLDTRPHRDASHHTEVVKRTAVSVLGRRPTGKPVVEASTYTDYVAGREYGTAARANTKAPQITQTCTVVREPPPPVYTNPAVLKGLGKAKLANCCLGCGKAYDSTCLGCCAVRVPAVPGLVISGSGWTYDWFQTTSGGDPTIASPVSWGTTKDVSALANYVPFSSGPGSDILPTFDATLFPAYNYTVLHITGYFLAPLSGSYVFVINSDDGTQLKVNGTLLYDGRLAGNMLNTPSSANSTSIVLTAGTYYPFEVLWANGTGGLSLSIDYTVNGNASVTPISALAYH